MYTFDTQSGPSRLESMRSGIERSQVLNLVCNRISKPEAKRRGILYNLVSWSRCRDGYKSRIDTALRGIRVLELSVKAEFEDSNLLLLFCVC